MAVSFSYQFYQLRGFLKNTRDTTVVETELEPFTIFSLPLGEASF